MVNQWTVLSRLKLMTVFDEDEKSSLPALCLISLEEVRGRLKDNAHANDPRVERAATGLAFYKLMLKRLSIDGAVTSFKAGDVSVGQDLGKLLAVAEKERDDALAAAVPLLKDETFLFKGINV